MHARGGIKNRINKMNIDLCIECRNKMGEKVRSLRVRQGFNRSIRISSRSNYLGFVDAPLESEDAVLNCYGLHLQH